MTYEIVESNDGIITEDGVYFIGDENVNSNGFIIEQNV